VAAMNTPSSHVTTTSVTTACLLSPSGRSALAAIGVRGPAAMAAVEAFFVPRGRRSLQQHDQRAVVFGRWGDKSGEELVVVLRDIDDLEVHCHGGAAASAAILNDLASAGCLQVGITAWQTRSDLGGDDAGPSAEHLRIAAEAVAALAHSRGPQATRILAHQLSGSLAAAVDQLTASSTARRAQLADQLLAWAPLGLRLTRPWRVVVAGPPNAGKSSLVNALAGFSRSIVSPVPGTTRDLLETRLVLEGWDLVLVDTAGVRRMTDDPVEQAGVARAIHATRDADLVLVVNATDQADSTTVTDLFCPEAPRLAVCSKSDLASPEHPPLAEAVQTSTQTGEGITELANRIITTLVPQMPAPGEAVPFTARHIELIQRLRTAGG
jgi:tRNA modification GTPase